MSLHDAEAALTQLSSVMDGIHDRVMARGGGGTAFVLARLRYASSLIDRAEAELVGCDPVCSITASNALNALKAQWSDFSQVARLADR